MDIGILITIALGIAAIISPIVVAFHSSHFNKKSALVDSRLKWLKNSKKQINSYMNELSRYLETEDKEKKQELLAILNQITSKKNMLMMQYKPHSLNFEVSLSAEQQSEERFEKISSILKKYKNNLTNDRLEELFLNYLYITEDILRDSFDNGSIYQSEIRYIADALPIIYSGVQKNEWGKISGSAKINYNDIVLENLTKLTEEYIKNSEIDVEEIEYKNIEDSVPEMLNGETVPAYFERVFMDLENRDFNFKPYFGKRGHKYLAFDNPKGIIRIGEKTLKNGQKMYYELNLGKEHAPKVMKKIIEKGNEL